MLSFMEYRTVTLQYLDIYNTFFYDCSSRRHLSVKGKERTFTGQPVCMISCINPSYVIPSEGIFKSNDDF